MQVALLGVLEHKVVRIRVSIPVYREVRGMFSDIYTLQKEYLNADMSRAIPGWDNAYTIMS